ncbi:antibiotic biosynthesis monooxygenase [Chromobacterium sp. Beijing]|uniref:antibiotic biosynthesis monooxygenase family protein n=1 Tax=Chromobacterium sp. Beijing TaxID=2735795 RepID=UPI001F338EFF|nr:antibiotic biosynthesis monooxygenase [Chromobacterium sp. Beijing]UJB31038.1 antibiotic biosynthesis monooxygenase [Chromobacterium sp. Beijing]
MHYHLAPSCWTVIFSLQQGQDLPGSRDLLERIARLAACQAGFLGLERGEPGRDTVSYWDSVEAIAAWRQCAERLIAQRYGPEAWYRVFAFNVSAAAVCPQPAAGGAG